jgi:hypothetical protein
MKQDKLFDVVDSKTIAQLIHSHAVISKNNDRCDYRILISILFLIAYTANNITDFIKIDNPFVNLVIVFPFVLNLAVSIKNRWLNTSVLKVIDRVVERKINETMGTESKHDNINKIISDN